MWLIRDSAWSRWFLEELWAQDDLVHMPLLRSLFNYEQRAFHRLFASAAWRRRVGGAEPPYGGANGVRAATTLVHQCVLNSLPSWYRRGDFVMHLAGMKGAVKCLLFRHYYLAAARAAGLRPGVDAEAPPRVLRCLGGHPLAT